MRMKKVLFSFAKKGIATQSFRSEEATFYHLRVLMNESELSVTLFVDG